MRTARRHRLWLGFVKGIPGRRFGGHYLRLRGTRGALRRASAIAGGTLLLVLGLLMLPTPIPGLGAFLMLAGAALLAGESRRMAAALDWVELRARRLWRGPARGAAFHPRLEQEYRAARFREYRSVARSLGIAGVVLSLGLWVRDYADDPVGAAGTFPLRVLMAAGVAIYVAALSLPVRRSLALLTGYTALLVVEFQVLHIWGRLSGGYTAGFPGYMYLYLLTPLVVLPFVFRQTAPAMLMVAVVPNVQHALGMAPGFPMLAFNALIWPACVIAIFVVFQIDQLFRQLFLSKRELGELATRDALTGLANRRFFLERAAELVGLAQRHGRPLCMMMIDIDHFKSINDRFGHALGDAALRAIAATLRRDLRKTDLCGRIGGEEFALVLPETSLRSAAATAERMRRDVAAARLAAPRGDAIALRVSIGVAALQPGRQTVEALLAEADRLLYQAKSAGRNRVVAQAPEARKNTGSGLELMR